MSGQIKCPKCGSDQFHSDKRGFKAGRAIAGTLIAGPLAGVATGAIGKNKIVITCLSCGNQFKPGEGRGSAHSSSASGSSMLMPAQSLPDGVTYVKQERANYACPSCGKVSSFSDMNKRCPSCGAYIKESNRVGYVKPEKGENSGSSSGVAIVLIVVIVIIFIVALVTCS